MSTIFLSLFDSSLDDLKERVINAHPEIYKKPALYDVLPDVWHSNDRYIRCHNGDYYSHGRSMTGVHVPLELKYVDVPDNTYIISITKSKLSHVIKSDDTIICIDNDFVKDVTDTGFSICDTSIERVLSLLKYLEENGGSIEQAYVPVSPFCGKSFDGNIKPLIIPFTKILKSILDTVINNDFVASNPKTKSVADLRVDANMTRAEFAKYFNIPYRTVENWEKNNNKCPDYLFDLMEFKLDSEEIFYRKPGDMSKIKFNGDIDISVFGKLSHFILDDNVSGLTILPDDYVMIKLNNNEHVMSDMLFESDDISKFIDDLISVTRYARDMRLDNDTGKLSMDFMYKGKRMNFIININDPEHDGLTSIIIWRT